MKRGRRPKDRHVRRLRRGVASTCIRDFDEIQPGDKVVLCCRVSWCDQRRNGNDADQAADLENRVVRRGAEVVGVVRHVGRGDRPWLWLLEAAVTANEHGAKLVAESTSRFIRHPEYHSSQRPQLQPRAADLEWLRFCTQGVTLTTVLHPDSSWTQERAHQAARGQRRKKDKGGRPRKAKPAYKKRRRLELLPEVKRLKLQGLSNREIGRRLGTDEKNVRRWGAAFLRHETPRDAD